MAASKQFLDTALNREGDQLESPSDSIETIFSTVSNPSRREETPTTIPHAHGSNGTKRSVHRQEYSLRFERRADFQQKSKLSKHDSQRKPEHATTELTKVVVDATETSLEEDWVCPVAVALRRVGYNVPLRPSKSWLERDRKNQALLRQKQASSKEM